MFTPHIRMVVRGVFDNSPEEWSFSLKWRKANPQNPDTETADFVEAGVNAALTTMFSHARFNPDVTVTEWRLYDIGADGRTQGNPRLVEIAPASRPSGTGTYRMPPQIALTVTTEANNRGHARFGRFYLPGPAHQISPDSRLSATNADDYLNAAVAMVKGISDSIDIPGSLVSVPLINVSNDATGTWQQVDFLRVGLTYDTLRSRRRQLLEDYRTSADIDW